MKSANLKNIIIYTATAYLLVIVAAVLFVLSGETYSSDVGQLFASLCMLFPLIATIVAQAVGREPILRGLDISFRVNRYWFIGWLLMPVIALLALGVSYLLDPMDFTLLSAPLESARIGYGLSTVAFVAITLLSGLLAGATINALFAFCEEVGWRGYLMRQLSALPLLPQAAVIGTIWGLWHAPLILLGHNYPQHPVAGIFVMIAMCIPLSVIIQFFRRRSGSVVVAAIMHGTFNGVAGLTALFFPDYNDLLVGTQGLAGIIVLCVVAAILLLIEKKRSGVRQ